MLEHLEAALAIADKTPDGDAGHLIERALDSVRAMNWPALDPNLETFRKGNRKWCKAATMSLIMASDQS